MSDDNRKSIEGRSDITIYPGKCSTRMFQITREEIEALDTDRVYGWITQVSKINPGSGLFYIMGYCDDSREVWQIPDVCRFFGELIARSGAVFFHALHKHNSFGAGGSDFWMAVGLAAIDEKGEGPVQLIEKVKQRVMGRRKAKRQLIIRGFQKEFFKKRGWRYG